MFEPLTPSGFFPATSYVKEYLKTDSGLAINGL